MAKGVARTPQAARVQRGEVGGEKGRGGKGKGGKEGKGRGREEGGGTELARLQVAMMGM